jgi:hypothetical protein
MDSASIIFHENGGNPPTAEVVTNSGRRALA